jgi:hypothetical protein
VVFGAKVVECDVVVVMTQKIYTSKAAAAKGKVRWVTRCGSRRVLWVKR